jgi:hypothetical protein
MTLRHTLLPTLALLTSLAANLIAADNNLLPALWDSQNRHPSVDSIPSVKGVEFSLVHEQTPDFLFLHEPRLAFHNKELFVSFSSAPRVECETAQIVRFRRSADNGLTWSPVGVLAPGLDGGLRSEVAPMLSHQGKLWAFVGRCRQNLGKSGLGMEVWQWFPESQTFAPLAAGLTLPNFIPFVQPQRMTNGNWIIGGHTDFSRHAAVAISEGDDLRRWRLVKIETPDAEYKPMTCPETCLLIRKDSVLAVTRGRVGLALASLSTDAGVTFPAAVESNLPMSRSKPFGGTLSTGQHFLIYNARLTALGLRRNTLLIAVTRPGELTPLRRVWKLIEGNPPELLPELKRLGEAVEQNEKNDPEATKGLPGTEPASQATMHEWAYPEAVEKDGVLYVTFSQDKRHCWIARIPVASLSIE